MRIETGEKKAPDVFVIMVIEIQYWYSLKLTIHIVKLLEMDIWKGTRIDIFLWEVSNNYEKQTVRLQIEASMHQGAH